MMRLRRWDFAVPMDAKGREVMAISSAFADDRARNLFPASTARRNQLCLAAEVIARAPLRVGTQQESSASWRLWGDSFPKRGAIIGCVQNKADRNEKFGWRRRHGPCSAARGQCKKLEVRGCS